ncbi:MAG: dicarboxylate transporter-DctP subunit, partial [Verrucomicrobia bacterium]|nr:dicarboxylate transporter-DctP subunit [Verrucomicrobiota bacterium]
MKLNRRSMLCSALAAVAVTSLNPSALLAQDKKVNVRLATLVPKGTSFHTSLQEMGDQWQKASGGNVKVTIFTDGKQGGEAEMVSRMRAGQLNAALLSAPGLSQIEESIRGLQLMPMMFASLEEFDYVRDQMRAGLEKKFLNKGFVVLYWGDAGWVHFFSKYPAQKPDDYKKGKMFVWSGDTDSIGVMKAVGINAVPLEQTDILLSLQTGLIDSVPSVPFFALAGQFDKPAPHMLQVNWVPLLGATVITKKAWDDIPANVQVQLKKSAEEAGVKIKKRSREEALESIAAMEKRGLKVTKMTPELQAE